MSCNTKSIGIIHTTPVTISSLSNLISEIIPHATVHHILDDTILSDMIHGNNVDFVKERWIQYARNFEQLGVHVVLSACSTVGAFAEEAHKILGIPVYRIDEAMAEEAVMIGGHIAVLATLISTLEPTVDIIHRKAKERKKKVIIDATCVEGAFSSLSEGSVEKHNTLIRQATVDSLRSSDVVVFAQASMATALGDIENPLDNPILTSPVLGIQKLAAALDNL